MTGLDKLRELRAVHHQVPRAVWVVDGQDERAGYWDLLPNSADRRLHAVVEIAEADIPESLDLRCMVGLQVHIGGERGASRLRRLHQTAIEAGARVVVTSVTNGSDIELLTHGI